VNDRDPYAPGPCQPIVILPEAIYDDVWLCNHLGVSFQTLGRARKSGELRFTRKGQRTLYLGSWVLGWLKQGAEGKAP
jgi:hypothetical protein